MQRLMFAALAFAWALPAAAQGDERPTNLQVLPEDMTRQQVTAIMRGFTFALGVRCSTCHVGEEGRPLSTYDFASDDKELKRTARTMLRMVRAINGEYLADIGASIEVQCFTCHRGAQRPERLEDALIAAWRGGGPDSLAAAYAGYRDRYYGRAVFDFGSRTLVSTAEELFRLPDGRPAARRALELQTTLFPDDGQGWLAYGQTLAALGDTASAIAALERGGALLDNPPQVQRMIQRLRGGT